MKIGLTYDLRTHIPPGLPEDYQAEFDSEQTVVELSQVIAGLGHSVHPIGNLFDLVRFLLDGQKVDLVFNIAEGSGGRSREAQVPALLEAYQIPYTFSDPLTLALTLDKAVTKLIWQRYNLPTLRFIMASSMEALNQAQDDLPAFPLFVKPLHEGSSKGISRESVVEDWAALEDRVALILSAYRQPALIEAFLPGREFTVAVLGEGDQARVMGIAEIMEIQIARVSGYIEKEHWDTLYPDTFQPVPPGTLYDLLSAIAMEAYRSVGCRDAGRIDLRMDAGGSPYLLEINPLPGLNRKHSALPHIAQQAGMSYEQLIGNILALACARSALGR
jgi:D-alanine-D-alanine ligase